jgi:hypothetical protein
MSACSGRLNPTQPRQKSRAITPGVVHMSGGVANYVAKNSQKVMKMAGLGAGNHENIFSG